MTRRRVVRTRLVNLGHIFSVGVRTRPRNFSSRKLVNLRGHTDAFKVQGSFEGEDVPGCEREMKRCLQKREVVRF
jgi:hypothetical protein